MEGNALEEEKNYGAKKRTLQSDLVVPGMCFFSQQYWCLLHVEAAQDLQSFLCSHRSAQSVGSAR